MVSFPQSKGIVARQAQAAIPKGTHEEQYSRHGFAGDQAMLYRAHASIGWTRIEGTFRNRAADTSEMDLPDMTDPRALPTKMMFNDDVAIFVSRRSEPMPYYFRDVEGDEVILVQRGHGQLRTDFGALAYRAGDYLVIPKAVNYRLVPDSGDNMFYIVQTTGQIGFPERAGIGKFVPFDLGILETPQLRATQPVPAGTAADGPEWEVLVRHGEELTSIFYPFDPTDDTLGWQGTIAPFRLSMYDIRSISAERLDIPPGGYGTFKAAGCLICTFTPHPMQSDPDSTFVPPYHRNVDYDEVTFVLASEDGTRGERLHTEMLFHTPQGAHHGPDANPFSQPTRPERFGMYLLNIDTERSLTLTENYLRYVRSR